MGGRRAHSVEQELMITSRFPQIAFFDMEGTLLQKAHHLNDGQVAPSAWTLLAERLGPGCLAAENETKRYWNEGKYSGYLEWMSRTVDIHRRFGLTRAIFDEVVSSVPLTVNANAALDTIHSWGTVCVLITGGFKALADRVQRELKIAHSFAACEYFFDEKTSLLEHTNLLPADEAGKVDFMKLICREYKADPDLCVFVGDGKNDVHMARAVGFSVAFNAQPELRKECSASVEQPVGHEDFAPISVILQAERDRRSSIGD